MSIAQLQESLGGLVQMPTSGWSGLIQLNTTVNINWQIVGGKQQKPQRSLLNHSLFN